MSSFRRCDDGIQQTTSSTECLVGKADRFRDAFGAPGRDASPIINARRETEHVLEYLHGLSDNVGCVGCSIFVVSVVNDFQPQLSEDFGGQPARHNDQIKTMAVTLTSSLETY